MVHSSILNPSHSTEAPHRGHSLTATLPTPGFWSLPGVTGEVPLEAAFQLRKEHNTHMSYQQKSP